GLARDTWPRPRAQSPHRGGRAQEPPRASRHSGRAHLQRNLPCRIRGRPGGVPQRGRARDRDEAEVPRGGPGSNPELHGGTILSELAEENAWRIASTPPSVCFLETSPAR